MDITLQPIQPWDSGTGVGTGLDARTVIMENFNALKDALIQLETDQDLSSSEKADESVRLSKEYADNLIIALQEGAPEDFNTFSEVWDKLQYYALTTNVINQVTKSVLYAVNGQVDTAELKDSAVTLSKLSTALRSLINNLPDDTKDELSKKALASKLVQGVMREVLYIVGTNDVIDGAITLQKLSTSIQSLINNLPENTKSELDKKVNAIVGKSLSTNDFTNTYKSILDKAPADINAALDQMSRAIGYMAILSQEINGVVWQVIYGENGLVNTAQIKDGAVTNSKLSTSLQQLITSLSTDVSTLKQKVQTLETAASFVTTPAAPTLAVVNDSANTFGWTNVAGFLNATQYEYTLDAGGSYLPCTANPQSVGDANYLAGQVGVRVKAVTGVNKESATLFNATAFTKSVPTATQYIVHGISPDGSFANIAQVNPIQYNGAGNYIINTALLDGFNYLCICVPAGKTVLIKDSQGNNVTSDFTKSAQPVSHGTYGSLDVYKKNNVYYTSMSTLFTLTIN